MKPISQLITPSDAAPHAPDSCAHCFEPIGAEHKIGSTCRRRTVVCRVTFELVRQVPEDWEIDNIEFSMNDSGCADNLVTELQAQVDRWEADAKDGARRCFCTAFPFEGKFVREATEEDEVRAGMRDDPDGMVP